MFKLNDTNINVVMFVLNNVSHDSRVLKEARSLKGMGYDVTIFGVVEKNESREELIDDIMIIRLKIYQKKIFPRNQYFYPLKYMELIIKLFFSIPKFDKSNLSWT